MYPVYPEYLAGRVGVGIQSRLVRGIGLLYDPWRSQLPRLLLKGCVRRWKIKSGKNICCCP